MPSARRSARRIRLAAFTSTCFVIAIIAMQAAAPASGASPTLSPGNLLVSTSVYQATPNIVAGTTLLPPGCSPASSTCVAAVADGTYPQVFNNDTIDPSFGVTEPITLDQLTTSGTLVNSFEVPNSSQAGVTSSSDQMVTSFSSKSELALNQSTDFQNDTFMGYVAPAGTIDVSNSNTPGDVDSTNLVTQSYYRAIAELTAAGTFNFTETNAYSGNNGRAAILNNTGGDDTLYLAGNGGNGSNPEPQGVVVGTGAQITAPSTASESSQTPGQPTAVGNFNVTELGDTADKSAKDDNFRGLAVENNVIYYTKGSGSNGVDTVYFLDTTGTACPNGVGLPSPSATLPTTSTLSYSTSNAALGLKASNPGLSPTNLCVLKGFPTAIAKNATDASDYPFGIWFANPTTLYVADEGSGDDAYSSTSNSYTAAAASTTAGLQKWVFNSTAGSWQLAYTLQSGLNLGQPYTVAGYPTGTNSATVLPWAPATDGLRNLIGQVNLDGTVTIWAITSTVSGSGDQGADPNQLVSITDDPAATTLPAGESFQTVLAPANQTVVRGVTFTPGSEPTQATPEVPWAPLLPITALGVGCVVWISRRVRSGRRGVRLAA